MSSGPESLEQIKQPREAAASAAGGLADRAERPSLTIEAGPESQQAGPAAGGPERLQNDRLIDRWGGSSQEPGREPGEALDRSRGDVAFPFDRPTPQSGQMERWHGGLSDEQQAALSDPKATVHVTAGASRAGSEAYNQRLSEARADAVATWLKDHGVRARITAEGTGETKARDASKPDGVDDPADRVARIEITPTDHAAEPDPGGHGNEGSTGIDHQKSDAGRSAGTLEPRSGLPNQERTSHGSTSEESRRAGVDEQSPAVDERGRGGASREASLGRDLVRAGAVGALFGHGGEDSGAGEKGAESRSGIYPDDPRWGGHPIAVEDWTPPSGVRESAGANRLRLRQFEAGATANPDRFPHTIRSSIGEAHAYQKVLLDGEIGLERPEKVHTSNRADFLTARLLSDGRMEIVANDVKTRSLDSGRFPKAANSIKETWDAQIRDAISDKRLRLEDPALEQQIRNAYAEGRVRLRQVMVDLSPQGQGTISGLDGPVPGHSPGATGGPPREAASAAPARPASRQSPDRTLGASTGPASRQAAESPTGEGASGRSSTAHVHDSPSESPPLPRANLPGRTSSGSSVEASEATTGRGSPRTADAPTTPTLRPGTIPDVPPTISARLRGIGAEAGLAGLSMAADLLENWVRNRVIDKQVREGFEKLGPQIQRNLAKLGPEVAARQSNSPDRPLYARITVQVGILHTLEESLSSGYPSWSFKPSYGSVELRSVWITGQPINSPREGPSYTDWGFTHYWDYRNLTYTVPVEAR